MGDLMAEMDSDKNGKVDIDEFVEYMSVCEYVVPKNSNAAKNVLKIKRSRMLQPIDFIQCFRNLPSNFMPSFLTQRMEQEGLNSPSYGLVPIFDCKTMTYHDM